MEDIKKIIQEELNDLIFRTVEFDEKLISTKTLDSISLVDLIVTIEEHLDISIPTGDIVENNFETINAMYLYLNSLKTND